jgi:hypothetical protein
MYPYFHSDMGQLIKVFDTSQSYYQILHYQSVTLIIIERMGYLVHHKGRMSKEAMYSIVEIDTYIVFIFL